MPQNGFHALMGAAAARRAWPGRVVWVLGFIVGSMIPDVDILPLAIARVSGHWGAGIHRTATHSIFLVILLVLAAGIGWRRGRAFGAFILAAALGMLVHVGLDLVFWFSGVSLLWPLHGMKGWREVNLWRWLRLPDVAGNPDLIGNELAALDAAAFALYLGYLGRVGRRAGVETRLLRFSRGVGVFAWGVFPVFVVTGAMYPEWQQSLMVYPSSIALFFPTALATTIALRRPLADG